MKKAIAAGLIVLGALTLTACDRPQDRYELCVENGGSWHKGEWGDETCTMPNTGTEDK